jgi:hypothetical protein
VVTRPDPDDPLTFDRGIRRGARPRRDRRTVRELRNGNAPSAHVELPPVVQALQASVGELSVGEARGAMRTPIVQASERPLVIAKDHEALAVNRKASRPFDRQVLDERDGVPGVPPVQQARFSMRRANTVKKPGK